MIAGQGRHGHGVVAGLHAPDAGTDVLQGLQREERPATAGDLHLKLSLQLVSTVARYSIL